MAKGPKKKSVSLSLVFGMALTSSMTAICATGTYIQANKALGVVIADGVEAVSTENWGKLGAWAVGTSITTYGTFIATRDILEEIHGKDSSSSLLRIFKSASDKIDNTLEAVADLCFTTFFSAATLGIALGSTTGANAVLKKIVADGMKAYSTEEWLGIGLAAGAATTLTWVTGDAAIKSGKDTYKTAKKILGYDEPK